MELSDEKILELALMSLGPQYKEITCDQLEAALTRRISLMKAVTRRRSTAMRVFEAQYIVGTIRGVEHEPTSNRDIISFKPLSGDEDEAIRTPRLEKTLGRQVSDRAKELVGAKCLITKVIEATKDPSKSIRVAYDIQPISG